MKVAWRSELLGTRESLVKAGEETERERVTASLRRIGSTERTERASWASSRLGNGMEMDLVKMKKWMNTMNTTTLMKANKTKHTRYACQGYCSSYRCWSWTSRIESERRSK